MLLAILLPVAYLVGSIPTSYLAARWLKGIDIRKYGSGSLGAGNTSRFVGREVALAVGSIDLAKAILVLLVALSLGMGLWERFLVGLVVVIGHNWSLFLGFHGGRGLTPIMGTLLVVAPKVLLVNGGLALALAFVLRSTPLPAAIALLLLPFASVLLGYPASITLGCAGLAITVFAKRLMGNERATDPRVLLYRFLYDRDVRDREAWVTRQPSEFN